MSLTALKSFLGLAPP